MQKHREKSPAGIIAISMIATSLVLGGVTFLFISYGLPVLPFSLEILYTVLLRLLPILIGLVLVLIALAIRPPRIPKNTDFDDEIQKDIYTMPLFNLPEEDETEIIGKQQLPVSARLKERKEESDQVDSSRLVDLEPIVKPFEGAPPLSTKKPIDIYEPDVFEPEIMDAFAEPFAQDDSTNLIGDHSLGRPVLFSEYPYSVTPDSQIAELLSPIDETTEEGDLSVEMLAVIDDSFGDRLESELASADIMGYELSLAIIDLPNTDTDIHSVDATIVQNLFNRLGIVSYFYLTEEHRVSAIMPFHGFEQSRRYFASLLESLRKQHPESAIKIGYSSSRNRDISAEKILQEASFATSLAAERNGYSLIGYDTNLEPEEE